MKIITYLQSLYSRTLCLTSKSAVKCRWAWNYERKFTTAVTANSLFKDGIVRSPFEDLSIPETPFPYFMLEKLCSHRDLVALVNGVTGEQMTYNQLHANVIKVASAFVRSGLRKGDVVTVLSPNCVEYAVLYLAVSAAGGIVSTLNPLYTVYELQHAMQESHSKWLVCAEGLVPTAQQARKACPGLKEIVVFGSADGCRPFSSLVADNGGAFPDNIDFNVKDDLVVLPFSSGTTGLPKGVMLTHYNLVSNIMQMGTRDVLNYVPEDVLVAILPLFHIYGQVVVLLSALSGGSSVVSLPRFEPESYLQTVIKHKATFLHVVPPVILFFAKHPLVAKYDFSSVHTVFTGAAPVGAQVIEEAVAKIKVPRFRQGYGLTEASPVTHCNPTQNYRFNTIGFSINNTEYKIVDINTGETLPEGKEGELCVRGPQVMKGYFNNPAATAHTIRDGWLHTGDVGYFESDGHAIISDRLKELIKYKGYQVAPAELEALLVTHPAIQDVAVIGKPDAGAGELPRAYVVFKPNKTATEEDIQKFVADRLAPYKQLRGGVEVRKEIPKSAAGKIMRRVLKDELVGRK